MKKFSRKQGEQRKGKIGWLEKMKLELWIYDDKKYKICELPEYEEGHYQVKISENEKILLECRKEKWYFPKEKRDEVKRLNHQIFEDRQLRKEDLWEYRRKKGKKVAILVFLKEQKLQSYHYYHLDEKVEYLIGSGVESDIGYNVAGMISKKHGVIKKYQGQWYLIDCSRNGIYEKGERIKPKKRIQYGESFSIFGLHLIFLEEVLAVGCRNSEKLKICLTEVIKPQKVRIDMMVTPHVKMLEQLRKMQKDREERYTENVNLVLFSCMMKTELDNILQNWRKNNCRDGIRAQIGVTKQGKTCELDLQEWADGPHGMIAGMTGAGKSQCMQSVFLSLAVRYSPEQLQFVLIDYKGGGMAEQFATFPHVAGVLTNLEGKLLHRGVCAIKSEIKRREQSLSREQVNHIDDYNAIVHNEKLPHLCIMIDEFAELKSQLPAFAETIVQVSRVGRSLGVHVILSTQKPSGEIENILLANSGFRICFKLRDKEQCDKMMGKMFSWAHKPAGRGFFIDGKEMKITEFQGAYTGHKQQSSKETKEKNRDKASAENVYIEEKKKRKRSMEEQICFVQSRVYKALREGKICSAVPLWMPPLPRILKPEKLQLPAQSIVMGLCDETKKQKQSYYLINPKVNGNIVLAGKGGSGKTTFLVGLVSQCIELFASSKFWLYLADFDHGLMSEFSTVPHVGGVVTSVEELKRCISFLEKELRKRKDSQEEIQCEEDKVTILFVIDNMTKLREKAEETVLERIYILLREGNAYGIYIILTAGGFGQREIPSIWRKYLPEKIALNMKQEDMDSFFGEEVKLPEIKNVPGRGVVKMDGKLVEFQSIYWERDGIQTIVTQKNREGCVGAKKLKQIPKELSYSKFMEYINTEVAEDRNENILFGIKDRDGEVVLRKVSQLDSLLILGKEREKREKTVEFFLKQALQRNELVIFLGEMQKEIYEKSDLLHHYTTKEQYYDCLMQVSSDLKQQNQRKRANNAEVSWIFLSDIKKFFEICSQGMYAAGDIEKILEELLLIRDEKRIFLIGTCESTEVRALRQYPLFHIFSDRRDGIYVGSGVGEQNYFPFPFIEPSERKNLQNRQMGMLHVHGECSLIHIPFV